MGRARSSVVPPCDGLFMLSPLFVPSRISDLTNRWTRIKGNGMIPAGPCGHDAYHHRIPLSPRLPRADLVGLRGTARASDSVPPDSLGGRGAGRRRALESSGVVALLRAGGDHRRFDLVPARPTEGDPSLAASVQALVGARL